MVRGSNIEGVKINHLWYSDWSWITSDNSDPTFFEGLNETLNDDCIREVIKHLDPLYLIYFARIDKRFADLISERKRLCIFPSTFGSIHFMNFRYLLQKFSSLAELSLSLHTFPRTFGFYPGDTKRIILHIICNYSGLQLKKIRLYDFHFIGSQERDLKQYFDVFATRGIAISISNLS